MQRYDFEVLKGDETISAERSVWLSNSREAWPKVAALAQKFDARGCRIRVTDQSGETVILIGVAGVRSSLRVGGVPGVDSEHSARIPLDQARRDARGEDNKRESLDSVPNPIAVDFPMLNGINSMAHVARAAARSAR